MTLYFEEERFLNWSAIEKAKGIQKLIKDFLEGEKEKLAGTNIFLT